MWFDGVRKPNTVYVASTSRGKDSTAMLRAIQLMGWPLDMIVSVDIWFDDETPAELPPMVKFKNEYDEKVLETFGIPVTRLCARKRSQDVHVERERESGSASRIAACSTPSLIQNASATTSRDSQTLRAASGASSSRLRTAVMTSTKQTYCKLFYRHKRNGITYGFPFLRGSWCNSDLKMAALTDRNIQESRNFQRCPGARGKK